MSEEVEKKLNTVECAKGYLQEMTKNGTLSEIMKVAQETQEGMENLINDKANQVAQKAVNGIKNKESEQIDRDAKIEKEKVQGEKPTKEVEDKDER